MYDTIVDMKANQTNIEQSDIANLLVTRNGEADEDYYSAIRAAERNLKVATATHRIIEGITAAGRSTARVIGISMLDAYAGYYDAMNHTQTRQEIRNELGVSWLPRLTL